MTPGLAARRVSKTDKMKEPAKKPEGFFGYRHWQIFMLGWIFLSCYATRITLSLSLVAMVNKTIANPDFEDFKWDQSMQSKILGSFYWGYIITQVPASIAAQYWGGHLLLTIAASFVAIFTILIPTAASFGGWQAVCACRAMTGISQGMVPPLIHTFLAKWVPLQERARMTTFVYTGGWVGNVIALQSSGSLSASKLGWPSCFYVWGGITGAFALLWFTCGKESPAETTGISLEEKKYIETSLGVTETTQPISTPWKAILTSKPVWALCVSQSAYMWGNVILMTKIPTYLNSVLGFAIADNGYLSSAPYLAAWLFSIPLSFIADYSVRSNWTSLRTSRVFCNTFGELIPGILLVILGYIDKDHRSLAVTILIFSVMTNVGVFCGHQANHMDLSPNFAGPIMGFTNATASIWSIVAPLVDGALVSNAGNREQWRYLFFLSAAIYTIGALSFLLFGSVEVQPWNDPEESRRESKFEDTFDIISVSEYVQNVQKREDKL